MHAQPIPIVAERRLDPLAHACGLPLHAYRPTHIARCLERALIRTGTGSPAELAERCRRDPSSRAAFRRSVLVPVTRMFRDREEFQRLETDVLPRIVSARDRIAVWSAGCANGDELHSVSALLDRAGAAERAELLGSDLHDAAVDKARSRVADLPAGLRLTYELRDLINEPAPAGPFDLVLCRNVLIYFSPVAQAELRRKLIAVLRPGGFLMLGRAEVLVRPQGLGLERVTRHIFRRSG